jgi:transcriptional regulatory protein GAL4
MAQQGTATNVCAVQKRNKPNTGSNYLGLAVRVALSLGLHRELAAWQIGLLEREMRRRVWWGLFIFDSGASCTFGRNILLPEEVDVKPVFNIPDEALTPTTTMLPVESTTPTIYSSLICQSAFHCATNSMANRLLSGNAPIAKESLKMHASIQAWRDELPSYFDTKELPHSSADWYLFAKVKLAWRGWNFEILAMRPFLMRWAKQNGKEDFHSQDTAEETHCRQICIDSAHATIVSIHQYVTTSTMPRLHAWYAL